MSPLELNAPADLSVNKKSAARYEQLRHLLEELQSREWPENFLQEMQAQVQSLNTHIPQGNSWSKLAGKVQQRLIRILEKKFKIVPKNYYRNLWMLLGMSAFGMPLGLALGMSIKNLGMIGVGIPIGMALGLALGTSMDKKAEKEGRQLAFEMKY